MWTNGDRGPFIGGTVIEYSSDIVICEVNDLFVFRDGQTAIGMWGKVHSLFTCNRYRISVIQRAFSLEGLKMADAEYRVVTDMKIAGVDLPAGSQLFVGTPDGGGVIIARLVMADGSEVVFDMTMYEFYRQATSQNLVWVEFEKRMRGINQNHFNFTA